MTEHELSVIEFNGAARSGKGTIVSYLCEKHPGLVTSEETGVDYRIITSGLLQNGVITEQMGPDEITAIVENLDTHELAEIMSQRDSFLQQKDELYNKVINGTVASVGRVSGARKIVKADFKRRVTKIRDQDKYEVLLLDGRNLSPVIQDLPGIEIALRVFVACSVAEAARREALRAGVEPESPAGLAILKDLEQRTKHDTERQIDPVRPDNDAVDYWRADANGEKPALVASETGRQLLLDTTHVSKDKMLQSAELILDQILNR